MAARRRIRPKTWAEVKRSLRPGVATIDASFCQELGDEELEAIAAVVDSCKRVKLPGTAIGQPAMQATLLPALLASSTLIDVQLPGCRLTHIPAELFKIKNIASINLSHNQLSGDIPPALWHARSLRRLELQAGEGSSDTPSTPSPAFPGAQQEHELGTFPPALPAGMAAPPRLALRHVNVAGCGLSSLAPSVGALRELQVLMAGRNPLQLLPEELSQCSGLAVLDVLGCPLAEVPPPLASRRGLELKTGLPDAILPWLFLGDATAAANQRGLQARGISRVLSLVQPAECLLHAGVDCLNVAVDDTPIARLGFATCPVPYFLRFALCPADETPTPAALGLSHGAVGGQDALVEAEMPEVHAWLPPHLAPHAAVSFGERGLPPLHLHAHRREASTGSASRRAGGSAGDEAQPAPLLVHCHAGASRSATATVAILMALLRWPLARAFGHVKARRGVVQPNIGFCDQLLHFERTLLQAGILDSSAPEFAPPPSPGPGQPAAWPNSVSMKQLVRQSAGSMSASVWNARYSAPAAAPKRRADPGLKLRALVKTVAAATRFSRLTGHSASPAAPLAGGGAAAAVAPTERPPGDSAGAHAGLHSDPRSLSATHASLQHTAPSLPAVGAHAAAPSSHRSWSVSTKWLTDADAAQQGAASPAPGETHTPSAGADGDLLTIRDGDESSSVPSRSPRRRPAGLAKRPSIDLSDWDEGKQGDAAQQARDPWCGQDDEEVQAARNRMRYAPNSARAAPPCLAALPHWAWRRLAAVFPGQRHGAAALQGRPLRLEEFGGGDGAPVATPPAGVRSPFPEFGAAAAAAEGGTAEQQRNALRPIVAAASAVSLADMPATMRKRAETAGEAAAGVPQVLGLLSRQPALSGGRHERFRLQSYSDHGAPAAPYADLDAIDRERHAAEATPQHAVTPQRSPGQRAGVAGVELGTFSPLDEGKKHHVLRRHSFGV